MKERAATTLTMVLILGLSPASSAEYLIYLKGGHYIVADNCTFPTRHVIRKDAEAEENTVFAEDCTKGKPEGRIFWSTIDGKFGELNAEDVYYIYGSKNLASIMPLRSAKPLEDYLIVNRGDSFINAKVVSESEGRVYGVKRDDLANINRRGVTEIVPMADAKIRSGEGLCTGERAEFGVSDTNYVLDNFVGLFKNLSSESCMEMSFDVEVYVNGTFIDKFPVAAKEKEKDSIGVSPGSSRRFSTEVPLKLREFVERSRDRDGGVHLCYTKVQSLAQCEAEVRQKR